ncbi:MAG: HEAT repeat domain-containing protein [Desulfitobacteriaceae bacterium]|nr:HEAT repeat domain-containing protein [Desulfitobacteriaceae bacterium]MDI6914803.1 HEAT repeat domain-containing protein [Desulfitobacteriaceae bacterium]
MDEEGRSLVLEQNLVQGLNTVLLEDWGGPRSPLALQFIRDTLIPDLVSCFATNADLWLNPTFAEIIAWKLKSQYAYPQAVVSNLTADLLAVVQRQSQLPQNRDPKEPWRRIFRLWVCEETLPSIEERTGYPLAYLELRFIRWKKLRTFLAQSRVSLLECLGNPELREYGFLELSFLYQFQEALAAEPLFKERLILEQVILELGLPLQVSDLVMILEIVQAHEGRMNEKELSYELNFFPDDRLANVIAALIALHVLQRNKFGKLALSEKSAMTIAPFLVPKIVAQLRMALDVGDFERAKQHLLALNPEVLVKVIEDGVLKFDPDLALTLLEGLFKQVNRRVDLYLLPIFGQFEAAFELLLACLGDHDSLIRAKACAALGQLGRKDAAFRLIQLLHDPVAEVKEMAAQALGDLGSVAGVKALLSVSEDYSEGSNVRRRAQEALRTIESRQRFRLNVTQSK